MLAYYVEWHMRAALFPKLDTDHDGLISRSEFIANFHLFPGAGPTGTTGATIGTGTDATDSGTPETGTGGGALDQD